MTHYPKLIVLEFNELCAPLLSKFMGQGSLPNFLRLYEKSEIFSTDAEAGPPNLEPWIQWPTVHSGLTYQEHGILNLGDGHRLSFPSLASILAANGYRSGIFGSMNISCEVNDGYYVPDPWNFTRDVSPEELRPYFEIVSSQIRESSANRGFTASEAAGFATFLVTHGVSLSTATFALRQIMRELSDPGIKWRRAEVLDHIQYDVFRHANRSYKVDFATFFCNSVAHFQHYYWRNMAPELFDKPPEQTEHGSLRDAILSGYQSLDRIVGRTIKDNPKSTVVLCTALSQRPWTDTTKCTFRPKDFPALVQAFGLTSLNPKVETVMAEYFYLQFSDVVSADSAISALGTLTLAGTKLMHVSRESSTTIFCGCAVNDAALEDEPIRRADGPSLGKLSNLFYKIHTTRSGRHDPTGSVWIGKGQHHVHEQKVPLIQVAPTILREFGINPPSYMRGQPLSYSGSYANNNKSN